MKRWQVIFAVMLDIEEGDTPRRVLSRAKAAMNKIQGKEIAHYYVLLKPEVVIENIN